MVRNFVFPWRSFDGNFVTAAFPVSGAFPTCV